MCKAVTLKSDSFHLAIVFYFPLYLFFRSLWNSDYLERPSKASLVLPCDAELGCVFFFFFPSCSKNIFSSYSCHSSGTQCWKLTQFLCVHVLEMRLFINKLLWQETFSNLTPPFCFCFYILKQQKASTLFMLSENCGFHLFSWAQKRCQGTNL